MFIKKIQDYDVFSGEADIIVSDGVFDVMCYCHPAELYDVGTKVSSISTLFAENIVRSSKNYLIEKKEEHYSYHLCALVVNKRKPIVRIGELEILLDAPIAKDIEDGEYVELDLCRLDCYIDAQNKV